MRRGVYLFEVAKVAGMAVQATALVIELGNLLPDACQKGARWMVDDTSNKKFLHEYNLLGPLWFTGWAKGFCRIRFSKECFLSWSSRFLRFSYSYILHIL